MTAEPDAALPISEHDERIVRMTWPTDAQSWPVPGLLAEIDRLRAALAATASPGPDVAAALDALARTLDNFYRPDNWDKGDLQRDINAHSGPFFLREYAALAADRKTPEGWTVKEVRE